MKIEEEIRNDMIKNIKARWRTTKYFLNNHIERIKEANTIEDVMRIKKSFLIDYIDGFMIGSDTCYFCLKNERHFPICKDCEYRQFHGRCGSEFEENDYDKIWDAKDDLRRSIEIRYYRGEQYLNTKFKKEIRDKIASGLQECVKNVSGIVDDFISDIENSKSVEELMDKKRLFLLDYVEFLPLGYATCYFCIENDFCCGVCEYGEHHKICLEDDSDYDIISFKQKSLEFAIRGYYFGETYD